MKYFVVQFLLRLVQIFGEDFPVVFKKDLENIISQRMTQPQAPYYVKKQTVYLSTVTKQQNPNSKHKMIPLAMRLWPTFSSKHPFDLVSVFKY